MRGATYESQVVSASAMVLAHGQPLKSTPDLQELMPEDVATSRNQRIEARRSHGRKRRTPGQGPSPSYGLVGSSTAIEDVRRRIGVLGPASVSVLILGETGTGKDLCAQALASLSGGAFIAVNCAAIPESLAESTLFGHERGSFTGAVGAAEGLIAAADGGVLFLDELGELSLTIQAKLLRTLQSGEYRRVGATVERRSSFRLLAATSLDMDTESGASRLYDALVHRVGAAQIRMPALRDRVEDIAVLAASFLERIPAANGRGRISHTPDACAALMHEEWPGNVRQLKNVVEVASVYAGPEGIIGIEHVAEALPSLKRRTREALIRPLAEVRRRAEERAILEALVITEGNRENAARFLGISEATLYRRLAGIPDQTPTQEVEGSQT